MRAARLYPVLRTIGYSGAVGPHSNGVDHQPVSYAPSDPVGRCGCSILTVGDSSDS